MTGQGGHVRSHVRTPPTPLRVGLIGFGAIGSVVGEALLADRLPGCSLFGVLALDTDVPRSVDSLDALLEGSQLIVEAAGQAALAAYGPSIVARGAELLTVSVGALIDPGLRAAMTRGPGRVEVSSGALGAFDALRAAGLDGGLDHVRLTTTKPPGSLIEGWMPEELQMRLRAGDERLCVFEGSAAAAVERFPRSVNVAATLALATLGFERTLVRVVADPASTVNEHLVEAGGGVGEYQLRFRNQPSPDNPRTSALTARAVQRRLADRAAAMVVGV